MNKMAYFLLLYILTCIMVPAAIANTIAVNADIPNYLLPVRMDKRSYGFYDPHIEYKGSAINYYINHSDNLKINFHGNLFTFHLSELIKEATNAWQNSSMVGGKPLLFFNQVQSLRNANMQFNVMNTVTNGLDSEITATTVQPNHEAAYGASVLGITPYARVYLFTDNLSYSDDFSYNTLHNLIFQPEVKDYDIIKFLLLWTLEHSIGHVLGFKHAPPNEIDSTSDTKYIMITGNTVSDPSIPVMINATPDLAAAVVYMTRLSAHLGRRLTLDDLKISPQEAVALRLAITQEYARVE
jgi:hypothetical protein